MVGEFFLIFCLVMLANLAISVAIANYGARKGFPFVPVLIASVFVGFPIVLLAVALMPARPGLDRR